MCDGKAKGEEHQWLTPRHLKPAITAIGALGIDDPKARNATRHFYGLVVRIDRLAAAITAAAKVCFMSGIWRRRSCISLAGKGVGRCPEVFGSPNHTRAIAGAPYSSGYQAVRHRAGLVEQNPAALARGPGGLAAVFMALFPVAFVLLDQDRAQD
jgi:hypothetical protein